jgi:membrane fusion protein (multidrug efflux system)
VIRAPFDGVISARLAEPGDVVPRYTHLLTLIDTESLITEVAISGLLIPHLGLGDMAQIRIDALGDRAFEGRITRLHPTLDSTTRRGIVEVTLQPVPAGALPGQLCRVTLHTAAGSRYRIPFMALRRDQQGEFVYLVDAEQHVHRTPVRSGLRQGDRVEILEGLDAGEQVVTRGFLGLGENMKVRVVADLQQLRAGNAAPGAAPPANR